MARLKGVEFPCPGCDGRATVFDCDPPQVLHTMPPCERWIELETGEQIVDYVRDARLKADPRELS